MRLDQVMDEVALAMSAISGVTVFAYPPPRVTGLCGYVAYPQAVNYDETYGRGEDEISELPIVFVCPRPTDKSTRDQVAKWASGDGPDSIKAAGEAWDWKTCSDLTIGSCEFDVWEIAGVPYLAAMFTATVSGVGAD
jgi:hypothetical protein